MYFASINNGTKFPWVRTPESAASCHGCLVSRPGGHTRHAYTVWHEKAIGQAQWAQASKLSLRQLTLTMAFYVHDVKF